MLKIDKYENAVKAKTKFKKFDLRPNNKFCLQSLN